MHRRAFLLGVAAPALSLLPRPNELLDETRLSHWRRFASPSGMFASLGVGVRLHATEAAAERARRADLADPFGRAPGEFYPGPPEEIAVPDDLPGHIRRYEAVIGAAAAERTIIAGGFRRGPYSWSVRVIEGDASFAVEAGEAIARFALPEPLAVWLVPGLLEGMLPVPEDFSGDVVLDPEAS